MKKTSFCTQQLLVTLLFLALVSTSAYAVQANPEPMTVTQPDGSTITIRLYGDESYSYRTTEDGYLIEQGDDGFYYFVEKDNNTLKMSKVKACEEKKRSLTVKRKVAKFDKTWRPSKENIVRKTIANPMFGEKAVTTKSTQANKAAAAEESTTRNILVILAQFSDVSFQAGNIELITKQLNQTNYNENGATGSVRDYYNYNSRGKINFNFEVVGPYTTSHEMEYYGGNDTNSDDLRPREFALEMCQLADNEVDFADFDADNDGVVDNVYIIYAGKGEANGGSPNTIWPHSWVMSRYTIPEHKLDEKWLYNYACSAELNRYSNVDGIGTFCHEFGHILGLPDLYDVDYGKNGEGAGLGKWSLMANGNYNNNSKTPPQLCILERSILGWEQPEVINIGKNITLPPLNGDLDTTATQGYKINTSNSGEYFLLENRKKASWDAYLPGEGMLIYHIDKSSSYASRWSLSDNTINAVADHQCAYIKIASGTALNSDRTPFPGKSGRTSCEPISWAGIDIGKPLTEIAKSGDNVTFKFMGGEVSLNCSQTAPMTFESKVGERSAVQRFTVSGSNLNGGIDIEILNMDDEPAFKMRKGSTGIWRTAGTLKLALSPGTTEISATTIEVAYEPTNTGDDNNLHGALLGISTYGAEYIMIDLLGTVTVDDEPTAISTFKLFEGVFAENGRIVGADNLQIFNLVGQDVTHLNGSLKGVYIVKLGKNFIKVIVK